MILFSLFCFSFLQIIFWGFFSSGEGLWTGNSQKPGKILKNWKNDSLLELL